MSRSGIWLVLLGMLQFAWIWSGVAQVLLLVRVFIAFAFSSQITADNIRLPDDSRIDLFVVL
jgi:hypothetical protein